MRAMVLLGPGQLVCQELPRPDPRDEEIVLKVGAALTCGTDLKAFLRGHPKWPPPTRFGHEYAGTVAAVGATVTGLREGDEVMLVPTAPCGSCFYCQRHQENLCTSLMDTYALGGYAEYLTIPARVLRTNLFAKPRHLSFAVAALLEPLSCVVFGLRQVTVRPDDIAVVIGAGAIGLLHVMVLRALGVERVYVIARNSQRAGTARQVGAFGIIPSAAEEAQEAVLQVTAGRGADLVVECTAQVRVWEQAVLLARPGGQVILFGGCPPGTLAAFPTARLHYEQVRIVSPFHFTPPAVRQAYELLCADTLPTAQLLSGTYPLVRLPEVLQRLQRGEGIKYVMIP
ncbi:MAG: alcohol dehydrogenase catalytic domain-containing protein [Candidatus Binatia bacterium]|nr:alcohol dehydrogenase catalytic domain-containing protein [Candidatus Binatia bacterium]